MKSKICACVCDFVPFFLGFFGCAMCGMHAFGCVAKGRYAQVQRKDIKCNTNNGK